MLKKIFLFLFILVVLLLLGGGLYFYFSRSVWRPYQNDEFGVQFDWPDNFKAVFLTEAEKESGMVYKLERAKPEAQVFLRVEKDLGPIRFTGKTILEYLVETIDRNYPQRFPEYYKEDQHRFVLAGRNAEEFIFTYKSPKDETRIRQRYVVIAEDNKNLAFFLSFQAPEKEFPKSKADFEKILASFRLL